LNLIEINKNPTQNSKMQFLNSNLEFFLLKVAPHAGNKVNKISSRNPAVSGYREKEKSGIMIL